MPHDELLLRCLIQCAHNCESKLWPALYMLIRPSYPRLPVSVTMSTVPETAYPENNVCHKPLG